MKKLYDCFDPGSDAYVAFHGMYRHTRGRRPSETTQQQANPRLAFRSAMVRLAHFVQLVRSAGFNQVRRLVSGQKYRSQAEAVMLVWNAYQIVPAECYRKAHYSGKKVDIAVCENPNVQKEQLGKRALIYHFD
jgi:hypothetical protein